MQIVTNQSTPIECSIFLSTNIAKSNWTIEFKQIDVSYYLPCKDKTSRSCNSHGFYPIFDKIPKVTSNIKYK